MAIVPGQSIDEWATLKPSSFALWCKLCDVKDSAYDDCYLELEKAAKSGIGRSAYFHAFNELVEKKWIEFSRLSDGKKWYRLVKGFSIQSANVDSEKETPTEQSANVDFDCEILPESPQTRTESTNTDSPQSANVDSSYPYITPLEEPQETSVSFGEAEEPPAKKSKKVKPEIFRLPEDYPLTDEMIDWAKKELPKLRLIEAHESFVEHWANRTDAKSERANWDLTWKKGMRLAYKWQVADDAKEKNGSNKTGRFSTKSDQWNETVDEYEQLYQNYQTM